MGLSSVVWGVRLWIWIYLIVSFFIVLGAFMYWFKETLKKWYYKARHPEKVVKIIIHYKSNIYRVFWRIIPVKGSFVIENNAYSYDDKAVVKNNDFFIDKYKEKHAIKVNGKKYDFFKKFGIKLRRSKTMELHYWYNNPSPLEFNFQSKRLEFNSRMLQEFKENDLFTKLLTLQTEKKMIMFLMMAIGLNIVLTLFVLAKTMGWIE